MTRSAVHQCSPNDAKNVSNNVVQMQMLYIDDECILDFDECIVHWSSWPLLFSLSVCIGIKIAYLLYFKTCFAPPPTCLMNNNGREESRVEICTIIFKTIAQFGGARISLALSLIHI